MRTPSQYLSEEYLNEYWRPLSLTYKREKTKNDYFTDICFLCDYTKKDMLQNDRRDIDRYFSYLQAKVRNGTLAQSTVNAKADKLHSVYQDLCRRGGYTGENPVHKDNLEQISEYIPPHSIPSLQELDDILEASKGDFMLYMALTMVIRLALTPGELLKIRLSDIILDQNNEAAIVFSYRAEKRYVHIPKDVLEIIDSYVKERAISSEYLLCNRKGNALRIRDLERRYKKQVYKNAVVTYPIQSIRNAAISIMLKAGAPEEEVCEYVDIDYKWIKRYNLAVEKISKISTDYVNLRIVNPCT